MRAVEAVSRILFSASNEIPACETVALLAREVPVTEITHRELDSGIGLVDLLVRAQLGVSKGAARKLIEGGGVYVNKHRQNDARAVISAKDLEWPDALLLRAGKKNYHLVLIR